MLPKWGTTSPKLLFFIQAECKFDSVSLLQISLADCMLSNNSLLSPKCRHKQSSSSSSLFIQVELSSVAPLTVLQILSFTWKPHLWDCMWGNAMTGSIAAEPNVLSHFENSKQYWNSFYLEFQRHKDATEAEIGLHRSSPAQLINCISAQTM